MITKCNNDEKKLIFEILKENNIPLNYFIPSKKSNLKKKFILEWTPMKNVIIIFNNESLIFVDIETISFEFQHLDFNIGVYKLDSNIISNLNNSSISIIKGQFYLSFIPNLLINDKFYIKGENILHLPLKQRLETYHDNRIYNFNFNIIPSIIANYPDFNLFMFGYSIHSESGEMIKIVKKPILIKNENLENFEIQNEKTNNSEASLLILDIKQKYQIQTFELRSSSFPECYFLYNIDNKNRIGLALIDSYECSQWIKKKLSDENEKKNELFSNKNVLNETFRECSLSTIIIVDCYFDKERNGWIPFPNN